MTNKKDIKEFLIYYRNRNAQTKSKLNHLVSIYLLEPKDVERFWPLAEFMVAEALNYSGKYADSDIGYDN